MTWNDEIVDEVRRVRNEHAKQFNYDIAAICADIRQKQAARERQMVEASEKAETTENTEPRQAA